jgi:hypothetical protein
MDDQLRDSDGTTPGRAGRPAQQQRSRRRFFEIVAGALALAFLGRTSTAASAAAGEPATDLPPEEQWCPGPDWERVPQTKQGGVGGWRNRETGDFRTDWFPRERNVAVFDVRMIDPDLLARFRCIPPRHLDSQLPGAPKERSFTTTIWRLA